MIEKDNYYQYFIDGYLECDTRIYKPDKVSGTITTTPKMKIGGGTMNLRIRKLTPKECFRLIGVKDEDYEKIAKNQSDASLYHLAGDSIVVDCIKAIYKQMIGDDGYEEKNKGN